jgi:hypothetical protein
MLRIVEHSMEGGKDVGQRGDGCGRKQRRGERYMQDWGEGRGAPHLELMLQNLGFGGSHVTTFNRAQVSSGYYDFHLL